MLAGCATKPKSGDGNSPSSGPASTPVPAASAAPAGGPPARATVRGPRTPWYGYLSPGFWFQKVFPKKPEPPPAEPPRLIGTVKVVNKDDKFVLIDAVNYGGTQPGDSLICIVNQRQTALLRASALRNPPFLIADITGGAPSPGDKVYQQ